MPFVPEEHHGKLAIFALMAYAGDTEAGERAVAPFRELAEPLADMLRPMPYPGDLHARGGGLPPDRGRGGRGSLDRFDRGRRGDDPGSRSASSTR